VSVKPDTDEGGVTFDVGHTAIGISKDKQDLIFEAFQQSDSSTTGQYGCNGLWSLDLPQAGRDIGRAH